MKVTIIKEKEKETNIISNILMLILGIILTLNANKLITTIFLIIGIIITCLGIISLTKYFKDKDNNILLISSISLTAIGLLTTLLASILTNAIQIISGIWLLIIGLNKLFIYIQTKINIQNLIISIILIILGIYTIFFKNAILIIIGIILIITSIYNILIELKTTKK